MGECESARGISQYIEEMGCHFIMQIRHSIIGNIETVNGNGEDLKAYYLYLYLKQFKKK